MGLKIGIIALITEP